MVLVVSTILAGCGTGPAPAVAPTGADPGGGPATNTPIVVDGDPSGAPATSTPIATSDASVSGSAVEVTSDNGFQYRISVVDGPTKVASFHAAGNFTSEPYTAPVGSFFLALHVKIENMATDRPEPLADLLRTFPGGQTVAGGLIFATTKSVAEQLFPGCATGRTNYYGWYLPDDLCALFTDLDSDSAFPSDEIPAGGALTVTLVAGPPKLGIPDTTLDSTLLSADPSVFQLYYASAESVIGIPIPPG